MKNPSKHRGLRTGRPVSRFAEMIADALDPSKSASKVRTLADMPEDERKRLIAELERRGP